ncbi:MAG: NHL repeat-containing protein [Terracidiphilus sp.]|jgi:sugar lactone lactonase YvrE
MNGKCRGWASAAALMGMMTIPNSSNSARAQQETSAFAATAKFSLTTGIATDSTGNVYVANWHNTILKITPAGAVMIFAGKPDTRGSADGIGSAATFVYPIGIATDSAANVYVADKASNTIRRITPAGVVTTLAGTAGVTGHSDGTGGNASFFSPTGVATDSSGNVYVADSGNNIIRKVTPTGVVTTVAGLAGESGEIDGIGGAARFTAPYSIATNSAGTLFVDEMSRHTLRKITPQGVVTTLAGRAGETGHADGIGTNATFYFPHGVAADKAGNIYVADSSNNTIRKVTPAGVVTTIAGVASPGEDSSEFDGIGSAATFSNPMAVATDSSGNVLVLEADNIREVTPSGVVTTFVGSVFGPWHLQDQFCEWDVPPEKGGASRSGTRRCSLNAGTTYCSSSIEVASANPTGTRPKLSLVYDGANRVTAVDTKFKLERAEKVTAKDDPPGVDLDASWLHYVVTIKVSSDDSCKETGKIP